MLSLESRFTTLSGVRREACVCSKLFNGSHKESYTRTRPYKTQFTRRDTTYVLYCALAFALALARISFRFTLMSSELAVRSAYSSTKSATMSRFPEYITETKTPRLSK